MTPQPRTLINRLLILAITVMTLAIFVLGAAIIWKLFLAPADPVEVPLGTDQGDTDQGLGETDSRGGTLRNFTAGTASLSYILPPGCEDRIETGANSLQLTFTGTDCADRQILSIEGDVSLISP